MAEEEYSSRASGDHSSDLMGSAKEVFGAAQSAFGGKTDEIDKGRVTGAAEDLLGAAKQYGKLDETSGFGQYVGKAEGYLHSYHSSNSKHEGGEEGERRAPVEERREEEEGERRAPAEGRREEEEEGERRGPAEERPEEKKESGSGEAGVGDYINMAKGFFN